MLNDEFRNWIKESVDKYKQDIRERSSYHKIKELYDKVVSNYLEELKQYYYIIHKINEYQQVIVFDCGHITYFGIEPELFPIYYEDDEYYKLCSDYNIILANLIMSPDFRFQETMFMKKFEWWSKLFKYCEVYPERILDYSEDNNYRYQNNEALSIFYYVDEKLPDIHLKKRYIDHQKETLSFEKNETFKDGIKRYNELYKLFEEEYLSNYSYEVIDINDYEKIITIEKDYILYFYMTGHSDKLYDGIRHKAVSEEHEQILANANHNDGYLEYHYIIQELTYNNLFKFNRTKFYKTHKKGITYIDFDYANLKKEYFNNDIIWYNRFKEIDQKYPELKIQERYDNWEGIQYYFIVYELTHKGIKGTGVTRTTDSLPNSMGRTLIKEYENYKTRSYNAFSFDEKWIKCMEILLQEAKETKWQYVKRNNLGKQSLLAEKVEYYVVPVMLKDTSTNSILTMQEEVLNNAINGKYKGYERNIYDIVDYKWKSEELVFECVRKIFKNKEVVHQYRPYYLHTGTGQLSYDVFVCGLNIAFEYQGKQHFEPVELFGGEENFKKQQERDKIKKELSEKNGIQLIYINYWEDINVNLIKEKLKENKINS